MNTTATTGISDAGAAPVGTNYNVCRWAASLPAPLLWCTICPSLSWYQLILLGGQKHVHVNNLPKVATW